MAAPYQEPIADVAFWAAFGAFALGEYAVQFRSRLNKHGVRAERASLAVVVVTVVGAVVAGFRLARWQPALVTGGRWQLFGFGLALMAAGFALRQWAVSTLGQFFTVDVRLHAQQTVVESGPYRWVRHPSYTGLLLFFSGLGFALTNWASLATLAVVPTVGLVVRIRAEESALIAGLGEPYRRFAAGRRRLLPGVW